MYSNHYSNYPQNGYHASSYRWQDSYAPPGGAPYYTFDPYRPGNTSKHKRRATADGIPYGVPPSSYYYEERKPQRSSLHRHHEHEPHYTDTKPRREHKRSYSYSTKQTPPRPTTRGEATGSPRQATEYDAKKAGIPSGFSLKHWDPSEEPILLLGSVFDSNSLGKWIYDWTVACHGAGTPLTEVAGDLWLLLIQLAGKIRRAEEKIKRIRHTEDREVIDDFLESGERLWQRFNKLLKLCEQYMLKSAKRHSSSGKKVVIGKDSGLRFVKCIFGRDRELERTEKIMTGIRLWSMRFDANCDEILRYA